MNKIKILIISLVFVLACFQVKYACAAQGGFVQYQRAGVPDRLTLSEDGKARYEDSNTRINVVLNKSRWDDVVKTFLDNDFFQLGFLDVQYPDKNVMGDPPFKVQFNDGIHEKTINGWPKNAKLQNIIDELENVIQLIKSKINCGYLTVEKRNVYEWPFSQRIPLFANLRKDITIDEEVVNFFRQHKMYGLTYFEGYRIYSVYYSESPSYEKFVPGWREKKKAGEYYLNANLSSQAIIWPEDMPIRLSTIKYKPITEGGVGEEVFIEGEAFQKVNEIVKRANERHCEGAGMDSICFSDCFFENKLEPSTSIYFVNIIYSVKSDKPL